MSGGARRGLAIALLAAGLCGCGARPAAGVVQHARDLVGMLPQRSQETEPVRSNEHPVAWLTIPAIKLDHVPVYDRGSDAKGTMRIAGGYSVTHYTSSAPIGAASNTVLYGHDDIEGSVFGSLASLQRGNTIFLTPATGPTLEYVVAVGPYWIPPNYTQILAPTRGAELTVFTCYPNFVDTERVFVIAVPPKPAS